MRASIKYRRLGTWNFSESVTLLGAAMPVAVAADPTPVMAASKAKNTPIQSVQNPPISDTPKKTKRRKHGARAEATASANVDEVPVASSSKAPEDLAWTWRSLTESSASGVPVLFTKDGRCVLSGHLLRAFA